MGYACQIEPNGAENGVWLRTYRLQAKGEGDAPASENSDGYRDLPDKGKERAYHDGIHTTAYFDFTADYLGSVVGNNFACKRGAAEEQLSGMKRLLEKNKLPYGGPPGEPPPPGED
jgi:hypothetical protein